MKKTPLDFTDCVRVVANVRDLDLDRYFIEVEFRDIHDQWAHDILPRSIIRSGITAMEQLLIAAPNFQPVVARALVHFFN
jgi:hypothetical protein